MVTLSPLFSWSKFIELIVIDDNLKRQFYTEICYLENWSVRVLRKKISGLLYERTAISHKPEKLISIMSMALMYYKHGLTGSITMTII